MAQENLGEIQLKLRNAPGKMIHDRVKITLVNQTLRSRDRKIELQFRGRTKILTNIPAHPNGHYQIFITPTKYRHKSLFILVRSNTTALVEETFFIDADKALPTFPTYNSLKSDPGWSELFSALQASGIDAAKYEALSDLKKGGLFNLHSKMQSQEVSSKEPVFSFVEKIESIEQDRIFVKVKGTLLQKVGGYLEGFHAAPGGLHDFPAGYERVASFKTFEKLGNLQLTFARKAGNEFLVDADIDDHQGIAHAFDVLKHKATGAETHPYDIHQILTFFQNIQPGYTLA